MRALPVRCRLQGLGFNTGSVNTEVLLVLAAFVEDKVLTELNYLPSKPVPKPGNSSDACPCCELGRVEAALSSVLV